MRKSFLKRFRLIIPVLLLLIITSCASTKKTKYFQDIPDSGVLKRIPAASYTEHKIQPHDLLTIYIQTIDQSSTAPINAGNISTGSTASPPGVSSSLPSSITDLIGMQSSIGSSSSSSPVGYEVDNDGKVDIPIIGKLNVVGYTTAEVRDIIQAAALKYYTAPIVIVRLANFNVTVLGEVARPGSYTMPVEKVSILDAIATAGDLTIYGKRDNVLLIREDSDGSKKLYRVNLKKSDIISSPYYYLHQNDVIYIEPMKSKAAATDAAQTRTFAILGSVLSILVIIATRAK